MYKITKIYGNKNEAKAMLLKTKETNLKHYREEKYFKGQIQHQNFTSVYFLT